MSRNHPVDDVIGEELSHLAGIEEKRVQSRREVVRATPARIRRDHLKVHIGLGGGLRQPIKGRIAMSVPEHAERERNSTVWKSRGELELLREPCRERDRVLAIAIVDA